MTKSIDVWRDLVVGDVIILEPGCRIPADCVVIDATRLKVDENYYHKGEPTIKDKKVCHSDNMDENPDCFLLSQSLILNGSGKAVVCSVGEHSRRFEVEKELLNEPFGDPDSPLAQKLEVIGGQLGMYGIYAALIICAVLVVRLGLSILITDAGFYDGATIQSLIEFFTLTVAIIAVAVPEGLPLAVSISLAYGVDRMEKDKILAKTLEAPEVMGGVEEICTGKTATLTQNDMCVAKFLMCG